MQKLSPVQYNYKQQLLKTRPQDTLGQVLQADDESRNHLFVFSGVIL